MSSVSILVGHLSPSVTKEHIVEIFSAYGSISSVEFVNHEKTDGGLYRCMLITYHKLPDAQKAVKYMDGGMIDKNEITVALHKTSS